MTMSGKKRIITSSALVLAIVFLWLILAFSPGGRFSANYEPGKPAFLGGKGVFGRFAPDTRVEYLEDGAALSGDPLYFSFYSARPILSLELEIEYSGELSENKPLIEAGVLMDKKAGNYQLAPVENYWLERYSNWSSYQMDGLIVLDRDSRYDSAEAFFTDLDKGQLRNCASEDLVSCLGTYRYEYSAFSASQAISGQVSIPLPLRGSHEFYTISPDNDLHLSFSVRDNGAKEKDIIIEAYRLNREKIGEQEYHLDENGQLSGEFSLNSLQAGEIVKIAIKADTNLIIESLSLDSSKLSFANRLDLYGSSYDREIFTDKPFVLIQGSDPLMRGSYRLGGENFEIDSTYKQFSFRASQEQDVYPLSLRYDNLEVANNGVFAFSADQLINPAVAKIDQYFRPDSDIRYIIARYQSPQKKDGRKIANIQLDMRGAYREKNRYQLVLSLPEPFAATSSAITVHSVRGRAQATSIWAKIKQIIKLD